MEWTSESRQLANHNPIIGALVDRGFLIDFVDSVLFIYGIPHIGPDGTLQFGDIAAALDLGKNFAIDAPQNHQVWFRGSYPHNVDGSHASLGSKDAIHQEVVPGFIANYHFSNKPSRGHYESFDEKIENYLSLITSPAYHRFPEATPKATLEKRAASIGSPLKLPDALSARDGTSDLASKAATKRAAIVGCGGTGAYILDFLSKTHLKEIALFDSDVVHLHTLFRYPGAFTADALGESKVNALKVIYSELHGAISFHPVKISEENLELLRAFDFIFIAVDDGPSRHIIAEYLWKAGIAFVDVGMGLTKGPKGLFGLIRCTSGNYTDFERIQNGPYLPKENAPENEYRRHPQLAELNALNAAMAVIRFKQWLGIYERLDRSPATVFDVAAFDTDVPPQ